MKDSQKKKKKLKKRNNRVASKKLQKTTKKLSDNFQFSQLINLIKKKFFWILAIFTVLNLILGIGIVFLIGQINKQTAKTYQEIEIPELPVLPITPQLNISAESLIVFEKDSRTVVFEKNSSLRFSPASTTKIMTALIALESYDLDQYLTAYGVSEVSGSSMGLYEGEQISVRNLLYGLMLPSGNDAAFVLSQNYPGGRTAFIERMNEKAKELRLYNTRFIDPAGYEDNNYSTAFDLARLALVAVQNPELKKIVETKFITVYDRYFMYEHRLENLNRLLYNEGVFGVKTGYTYEAGQVLVTLFESNGKTFIVVVLKSQDRFFDTELILNEIVKKVQLVEL